MRRPSVIFLLAHSGGIMTYWHGVSGFLPMALLLTIGLCFVFSTRRVLLCLMGFGLGLTLSHIRGEGLEEGANAILNPPADVNPKVEMKGTFYQRDFLDEKSTWLKIESGQYCRLQFSSYIPVDRPESGTAVKVYGKFSLPQPARNPNGFDEKKWLYSKNAVGTLRVEGLEVINHEGDQSFDKAEKLRVRIGKPLVETLIQNTAFKQGPLAAGMLLGEDGWIPENVLEAYKISGTNHILSVSGAHFGVLLFWIHWLMERLKASYYTKKIGVWLILGCFIWLIGMDTAAIRAYLMFLLLDLSRWSAKQSDGFNGLCLTAIVLLLLNPFIFWDIGLQLAFSAMYGLLVLYPFLLGCLKGRFEKKTQKERAVPMSWWQKSAEKLGSAMLLSICACLCLYPILRTQFNQFSWWSIVYNLPVSVLSAVYLPLGVLEGFLAPFPGLSRAVGLASGLTLKTMTAIVGTSLALPGQKALPSLNSSQIFAYIAVLMVPLVFKQCHFAVERLRQGRMQCTERGLLLFAMPVLLVVAIVGPVFIGLEKEVKVHYFDVGQGDGAALVTPGGQVLVMDAGLDKGQKQMAELLLKAGIGQVDYLVLSHPHADHISGAMAIIETLRVKELVYFDGNYDASEASALAQLSEAVESQGGRVSHWSKGTRLELDNAVELTVLHPDEEFDSDSANDESLVVDIAYEKFGFLFTGDISTQVEYDIIEQVKNSAVKPAIRVLKVPHHGSSTSSGEAFIEALSPALAVIQVGEGNRYGHPKDDVLDRYIEKRVPVLRNDESGCVTLITDGIHLRSRLQIEKEVKNVVQ